MKIEAPSHAIAHHADLFPAPVEIRSHIRAALAADPTGEAFLDIGQSGIIGPCITVAIEWLQR